MDITDAGLFYPSSLVIPKGATVIWYNTGTLPYSVVCDPATARDPAKVRLPTEATPWSSGLLYPGQTWAYTFNISGDFLFTTNAASAENSVGTISVRNQQP